MRLGPSYPGILISAGVTRTISHEKYLRISQGAGRPAGEARDDEALVKHEGETGHEKRSKE